MNKQIYIKKGLDIPLSGMPDQSISAGPVVSHVALFGLDYPGLKPRLLVNPGDAVGLGQPLFVDKRDPAVKYTAPGQGTVIAINRGVRRVLESIVIRLEDTGSEEVSFKSLTDDEIHALEGNYVASRLQQSGLWTALRTRPYSRVPASDSFPRSIFVTAIDTQPLAADPQVVTARHAGAFGTGLLALSQLTDGAIHLCTAADWAIPLPDLPRLQQVEFLGPHPAGLPGTHIHHLDPVGAGRTVWHIAYQDVIAIGQLFGRGTIDNNRVISLAGDGVTHPRLIETRLGASCDEIVANELTHSDASRVISGSVLNGRTASGTLSYLGRYHQQLCVIPEGGAKRLFDWLGIPLSNYSASSIFLRKTGQTRKVSFTTSQHGPFSGMIPLRVFETVMPLDILPSPLFRALMVRDTDQAQALGCLELDEEDLALSTFVCPAKYDYGAVLRINLEQIERETR